MDTGTIIGGGAMEIKMRINIERSPARRVPVTYPLNLSALKSVTGHHGDRPIKS